MLVGFEEVTSMHTNGSIKTKFNIFGLHVSKIIIEKCTVFQIA